MKIIYFLLFSFLFCGVVNAQPDQPDWVSVHFRVFSVDKKELGLSNDLECYFYEPKFSTHCPDGIREFEEHIPYDTITGKYSVYRDTFSYYEVSVKYFFQDINSYLVIKNKISADSMLVKIWVPDYVRIFYDSIFYQPGIFEFVFPVEQYQNSNAGGITFSRKDIAGPLDLQLRNGNDKMEECDCNKLCYSVHSDNDDGINCNPTYYFYCNDLDPVNTKYNGRCMSQFPNGRIYTEQEFVNGYLNCARTYYDNGQLHSFMVYKFEYRKIRNDTTICYVHSSQYFEWHKNGKEKKEMTFGYDGNIPTSTKEWDENGNLIMRENNVRGKITTETYIKNDSLYITKIKEANKYFCLMDYEEANVLYVEAMNLKPDEEYPQKKIETINYFFYGASIPINPDSTKTNDAIYNLVIIGADMAFANKDYLTAKKYYLTALSYTKKKKYSKERIAQIDKILQNK